MLAPAELRRVKEEYASTLANVEDGVLRMAAKDYIWLSALANNNPHSKYHWMCDAVYDECKRRGKTHIYTEEHAKAVAQAR